MAVSLQSQFCLSREPLCNIHNPFKINKKNKLPQGWEVNGYYKPTGKAELITKDGKAAFQVTANAKKATVLT